jgi:hypothetical protein
MFTLRRDNLKSDAVGGDSMNTRHALRDTIRHTLSDLNDHQQHRRDRRQDNSGDNKPEHAKTHN